MRIISTLALLASLTPGIAAQVATATLTPDRDNTIYSPANSSTKVDGTSCNTLSNGTGDRIIAGLSNNVRRGLLHFDVAGSVPPGATILQVELDLTVTRVPSGAATSPDTFALHPATADWGEGASFTMQAGAGTMSQTDDANWCDRFFAATPPALWSTPGGDFGPASATASVGTSLLTTQTFPSTLALVADVQSWVDNPANNFGWFLLGDESASGTAPTTRAFGSREDPARAPRLIVTYFAAAPYWSGCDAGGASPPTLGVSPTVGRGRAAVGETFQLVLAEGGVGITGSALLLGSGAIPSGLPLPPPFAPCLLHVTADLWNGATEPGNVLTLPLPPASQMVGLRLYWQGVGLTLNSTAAFTHAHVSHVRN